MWEKFIVVGNEQYGDGGPVFGYSYGCFFAPENEQDKVAGGRVTQRGNLIDDWAVYYFKDDAEKEVKKALAGDSNDDLKNRKHIVGGSGDFPNLDGGGWG